MSTAMAMAATEELFRTDAYLQTCTATIMAVHAADPESNPDGYGAIQLDRTVFYPMGGGQPGDSGTVTDSFGAVWTVRDTRYDKESGAILHILGPAPDGAAALAVGATLTAVIDWERRHRLMRMHSCLHLLCSVVPGAVTGGSISDGKGRLDFDLPDGAPDKVTLTEQLNSLIAADHPTEIRWITDADLAAQPDLVRTMSVKPPTGSGKVRLLDIAGVDLQPCGGTHIRRTGEIGPVNVSKIEKKGRMNRRITVTFANAS